MSKIKQWTDSVNLAVKEIGRFQSGESRPLSCGIPHVDINLVGGLRGKTIFTLAGYTGMGKTYLSQRIINGTIENNPNSKIAVLKMNFEMSVSELILRRLQMETHLSIEEILLSPPSDAALFKSIIDKERGSSTVHIEQALTPEEFEKECRIFLDSNTDKDLAIIELDHCSLVQGEDKKRAVDKMVEICIKLKQEYDNSFFLLLAQLNRSLEGRTLITELAPRLSDVYASSTMGFASTVILIVHQPSRMGIQKYLTLNVEKYHYLSDFFIEGNSDRWASLDTYKTIFYHYVKNRVSSEIPDIFAERYGVAPIEKKYTDSVEKLNDF
jgi:replicative DNA helicase